MCDKYQFPQEAFTHPIYIRGSFNKFPDEGHASGPGDLGSIPSRVIPKTQKMVLDASLLNTQHYKVRIKGKVEQSREGVAPSPTHWCSSYRKGSFRVTLDYGRQLYLLYLLVSYQSNLMNIVVKLKEVLGLEVTSRVIGLGVPNRDGAMAMKG